MHQELNNIIATIIESPILQLVVLSLISETFEREGITCALSKPLKYIIDGHHQTSIINQIKGLWRQPSLDLLRKKNCIFSNRQLPSKLESYSDDTRFSSRLFTYIFELVVAKN
jgi:hypothetical protein